MHDVVRQLRRWLIHKASSGGSVDDVRLKEVIPELKRASLRQTLKTDRTIRVVQKKKLV